jgi:hypothetical protein
VGLDSWNNYYENTIKQLADLRLCSLNYIMSSCKPFLELNSQTSEKGFLCWMLLTLGHFEKGGHL